MAKSYVITNRRKLDQFFREGGKIEGLAVQIGQLSGKPKYPVGHVGAKSRQRKRVPTRRIRKTELARRSLIRGLRGQLADLPKEQRKEAAKSLRRALRADKISSKGLTTKRAKQTAVAKVAGVLAAAEKYHGLAVREYTTTTETHLQEILEAMKGRGGTVAQQLKKMGKGLRDAVRRKLRGLGHFDTGKLFRNTQFAVVNKAEKARVKAELSALRAQKRAAKRAKKAGG